MINFEIFPIGTKVQSYDNDGYYVMNACGTIESHLGGGHVIIKTSEGTHYSTVGQDKVVEVEVTYQPPTTEDKTIQKIVDLLLDRTDGPVDRFVAISRATNMAERKEFTLDEVTNGLIESLDILAEQPGQRLDSNEF